MNPVHHFEIYDNITEVILTSCGVASPPNFVAEWALTSCPDCLLKRPEIHHGRRTVSDSEERAQNDTALA